MFTFNQILGLMVVRKLLDYMFSQHDLAWLDDILPEKDKKKKEDKKKGKAAEQDSDEEVRHQITPTITSESQLTHLHCS